MHAIFFQKMSDAWFQALVDTGMKTPTNTGIAELKAEMLGRDLTRPCPNSTSRHC